MPWLDLNRWEHGCEPDWLLEARAKDVIERRARYQSSIKVRNLGIAEAATRLCVGGKCSADAVAAIMTECKSGPVVVRRQLAALGYEVEADSVAGYPSRWTGLVRSAFRRFLEARMEECEKDFALCDDICLAFVSWARKTQEREIAADIEAIAANRGIAMALRTLGYKVVRRNAGMAVIGYYIK